MSMGGHSVTVESPQPPSDAPETCREFGYGLGRTDGILVLKYLPGSPVDLGESRQDFLHQLYWSPDGALSTWRGATARFVGPREAFWAHRAVAHDVRTSGWQTVYRVCLRQVPRALEGLSAGPVSIDAEATRLLQEIARSGHDEDEALLARERIMNGLAPSARDYVEHHAIGAGYAMTVARALSHDPGDPTRLGEWAARLHISVKTLQRDFEREFGSSFSRWRTMLRLQVSRVLLETCSVTEVAHRVGYASPSAFVAAFAHEFGHTPGGRRR